MMGFFTKRIDGFLPPWPWVVSVIFKNDFYLGMGVLASFCRIQFTIPYIVIWVGVLVNGTLHDRGLCNQYGLEKQLMI